MATASINGLEYWFSRSPRYESLVDDEAAKTAILVTPVSQASPYPPGA